MQCRCRHGTNWEGTKDVVCVVSCDTTTRPVDLFDEMTYSIGHQGQIGIEKRDKQVRMHLHLQLQQLKTASARTCQASSRAASSMTACWPSI
jgi:hypothetical protein